MKKEKICNHQYVTYQTTSHQEWLGTQGGYGRLENMTTQVMCVKCKEIVELP